MQINSEVLAKFHQLNDKVKVAEEIASESLRTAQDRFNHRTHKLQRDGKEVEIKEKTLWDEVFYLGEDSEAGRILKVLHPKVFENYAIQNAAAMEYKRFGVTELGVDPGRMTMSDQMKMVEAMVEYKMSGRTFTHSWFTRAIRQIRNWLNKTI